MKEITSSQLLAFATQNAGMILATLSKARPFVVDVQEGQIVFYPESRQPFWLEVDEYVRVFNETNSLKPGDYPKRLWTNSYFVGLVDALLNGIKPVVEIGPQLDSSETPEPPSSALDQKVRRLRALKTLPPPPGRKIPRKITVTSTQITRDPAVRAWVLDVSQGVCSSCRQAAPFKDNDGFPFLEVHHVIPLVEGGPDTINNAVALCPNCHRAIHHAKDRRKRVDELYKRHARLKR